MNSEQKTPYRIQIVPGIWIVAGVLLLCAVRIAWEWANYPHDIKRLARELSSINVIQQPPVVNHAGTLIGVVHTTEQGVGVFTVNAETQVERKLAEVNDVDYVKPEFAHIFGWSPNDKFFAFSVNTNLHFLSDSGEESVCGIDLSNSIYPFGMQPFTWLSQKTCAYIDRNPKLVILQYTDGQWQETTSWLLPTTNGKPQSLQAVNTNMVAWQTDNTLWQINISSGAIAPIYSDPPNIIRHISYSKYKDAFLLVKNTNRLAASSLIVFKNETNGSVINELTLKSPVLDAQWIDKGKEYAYVSAEGDHTVLTIKRETGDLVNTFFAAGQVWNIFCDGENSSVYALAAKTNEPAGIWQCKAGSDDTSCIVSPWGNRDVEFHFQPALKGQAEYLQAGRHNATFDLVPPANFSRQKKYPLVIGTAGYEWTPIAHGVYAQCLANSGAYVALVNYRWNQNRPETVLNYTNNVLAVYNQLIRNPNIDRNRVFLFGFSTGTVVVGELVKDFPGRWRGIMLFNPTQLPEERNGMTMRVLATGGSGEMEEDRFQRYQEQLLKVGIPMDWYIDANSGHVPRNKTAMYERALSMADMVFEEKW
jgi:predicted esterase